MKPWSLARRITLAFALTTALLTSLISVLAGWKVWRGIEEELDALAREELDETCAYYARGAGAPGTLELIARELSGHHPQNLLAWRVWRTESGEVLGEFGKVEILRDATAAGTALEPRVASASWRWVSGALTPELSCGILVDGSHQMRRFLRFTNAVTAFVIASTLLAALAGRLLGRHVSRLLARVARGARAEETDPSALDASGAPEEIRAVVLALGETLGRIRSEAENARLITSGLAHELRSPLQNLIGETQVVLLRERRATEYRQVLESHLEELGQLGRVVDNLVTLCSSGELRRRRGTERFDLGHEARLRLSREFQLAARRGVNLSIETDGPLDCEGDREALLLALRNVVTNAIEWSPKDGRVDLRLAGDGERCEITVDDAGPGVRAQERERIFEPFHRGVAARGRRVGFGLGLALTRSAVEAHGGSIDVGDSPLGGARFRIVLPRAVLAGHQRDRARPLPAAAGGGNGAGQAVG